MIQAIKAIIDQNGNVKLLEPIQLSATRRALVIILDLPSEASAQETAILSESSLSTDWLNAEEDAAWQHLQSE